LKNFIGVHCTNRVSLGVVGVAFAVIQGGLIRIIIPKLGQQRSVYLGLALYALGFLLLWNSTVRLDDVSGYYYLLLGKYCGSGYSGNHFNRCAHPMSKVNYKVASRVWQVLAAIIGPLTNGWDILLVLRS
jgi:hypothetical protein